jgi:hypothetical protein
MDAAAGAPLVVTYRVSGQAEQVLDLALFPEHLGQTYASLSERRTRLLFAAALDTEVLLDVVSESPLQARSWPEVSVVHPLLTYQRRATVTGQTLHAERHLRCHPAVVEPADYGVLARHLREVDAAESLRLER